MVNIIKNPLLYVVILLSFLSALFAYMPYSETIKNLKPSEKFSAVCMDYTCRDLHEYVAQARDVNDGHFIPNDFSTYEGKFKKGIRFHYLSHQFTAFLASIPFLFTNDSSLMIGLNQFIFLFFLSLTLFFLYREFSDSISMAVLFSVFISFCSYKIYYLTEETKVLTLLKNPLDLLRFSVYYNQEGFINLFGRFYHTSISGTLTLFSLYSLYKFHKVRSSVWFFISLISSATMQYTYVPYAFIYNLTIGSVFIFYLLKKDRKSFIRFGTFVLSALISLSPIAVVYLLESGSGPFGSVTVSDIAEYFPPRDSTAEIEFTLKKLSIYTAWMSILFALNKLFKLKLNSLFFIFIPTFLIPFLTLVFGLVLSSRFHERGIRQIFSVVILICFFKLIEKLCDYLKEQISIMYSKNINTKMVVSTLFLFFITFYGGKNLFEESKRLNRSNYFKVKKHDHEVIEWFKKQETDKVILTLIPKFVFSSYSLTSLNTFVPPSEANFNYKERRKRFILSLKLLGYNAAHHHTIVNFLTKKMNFSDWATKPKSKTEEEAFLFWYSILQGKANQGLQSAVLQYDPKYTIDQSTIKRLSSEWNDHNIKDLDSYKLDFILVRSSENPDNFIKPSKELLFENSKYKIYKY